MNLIYKNMIKGDYESCAYELVEAFKGEPWYEEWSLQQAYIRIEEIMSSRVSRGYVIYDGDSVVSMACGRIMTYLDRKELWIDEFSVHPDYQGKGVGSAMLDYIRSEVKKEKEIIAYIGLHTEKGFPAVKFYEKNGFEVSDNNVCMFTQV